MAEEGKIRVLISKIGFDGHVRGAKMVATALREAGMEVIYLGPFQTPEKIVRTAMQEDVDVVGLSCHCGEHLTYVPEVVRLLREGQVDVPVVVGGILPKEDIPRVKAAGVAEVFVGTLAAPAVEFIREICEKRGFDNSLYNR